MNKQIKLSIVCITYNHEKYIRDCLNGFVIQKTDFYFEILINDDASTDKTADIIREYEATYPHLFRCVYQRKNQWRSGKNVLTDILFPMIRGKYVALCEGDDYWTDPLKLQKQVDFLDNNPEFSMSFHPVIVHWENNFAKDSIFPNAKERFYKTMLTLADLLDHNFIQTNSVVYRWRFHREPLSLIPKNILPSDWFLHLLHAQVGKICFLQDIMAVYRRNQAGIWTGAFEKQEWFIRYGIASVRFYLAVQKQFGINFNIEERDKVALLTYISLKNCGKHRLMDNLLSLYQPPLHYLSHPHIKYCFYYIISCFCFGKLGKKMRGRCSILKNVISSNCHRIR